MDSPIKQSLGHKTMRYMGTVMEDNVFTRRYDAIVVDGVNFAYRTFRTKNESPIMIGKKSVYKDSICEFITRLESLKDKYLKSDGDIYLLFDNYTSKADLRSTYMFADRKDISKSYKSTRKKDTKEFYNSVNFLRYFYLIGPENYHTVRVDGLEADDLVEPLFEHLKVFDGEKTVLMVTTDMDWTRYLAPNVDWFPNSAEEPQSIHEFSDKMGFDISKKNVILYKSVFGDASDNIKGLLTENRKNMDDFVNILESVEYPEHMIMLSRDVDKRESNSVLKAVSMNEKMYLVNLQLVSSVKCGVDVIRCSLTNGRNADTLYHTVREAIGLDAPKDFVFGNIRRNRIS